MEQLLPKSSLQIPKESFFFSTTTSRFQTSAILITFQSSSSHLKLPKNLRYPRRAGAAPLDPQIPRFPLQNKESPDAHESGNARSDESEWSPDELEAIAALFQRRMPQKPGKRARDKPPPLPSPNQIRPQRIPTPKRHIRLSAREILSPRSSFTDQVFKNPDALIRIAREIAALPHESDASEVLDEWSPFLRKGSLSMTIRELGHMGLPKRALETLCWVQKQRPVLFPDDRTLSSTIEILARNGELKIESELEKFMNSASRSVVESMTRGFIKGGDFRRARQLLLLARDSKRTLDPSLHAKLIHRAGRTPNGYKLARALLDELGERESLDLNPQDTNSVMKVCIKLGRFETVQNLFNWFRESGGNPSIVMYTTMLHSRFCSKNYTEGLALIWEMEGLDCLLDLPAFRVVIRLCVALNDLERAARYFSRLKEAGFIPTYDIYKDMIKVYANSGRLAKCRKICREVEMAGLRLDEEVLNLLSETETEVRGVF
ncbi:Pentatricopeptide repeat-containing protein [Platanthera zijinensis]|uniref:Pentatricopeptide repeat-containing protein n=1 Tax=Platanthera zijinensis TaxID=2320716 RepID=A0AAP0BDD0_9ASPA